MPDARIEIVTGQVVEVGGTGASASFVVRDTAGKAFRFRASPESVRAVAPHLFGAPVRVVVEVPVTQTVAGARD